uniref:hypothetical protein n=1 Tax=Flavobacterium sp. TaxID=239 RepID=UPI0040474EE3
MNNNYEKSYLNAYQVVRAVLETAERSLQSPHPLWLELNDLIEICDRMEKDLQIANSTNAFKQIKDPT